MLNNKDNTILRATSKQRRNAAVIFFVAAVFFTAAFLAARGKIALGSYPCGFKQRYGLPCPTCGMTTAVLTFAQGKILDAFMIQPAAAFLCVVLAISGFLAFIVACFGVYFPFLNRLFEEIKIRHIILALIFILAGGWAVTLARAVAMNK